LKKRKASGKEHYDTIRKQVNFYEPIFFDLISTVSKETQFL